MRDRLLIFSGLLLFVVLVTFPVWKGIVANSSAEGPVIRAAKENTTCVLPVDAMRVSHSGFLNEWRDARVRGNMREYTAYDGKIHPINLTATCLECHGGKDQFCISCHTYVGVSAVDCWDCHTSPPPVEDAFAELVEEAALEAIQRAAEAAGGTQ